MPAGSVWAYFGCGLFASSARIAGEDGRDGAPMSEQSATEFGCLLRRLRNRAQLTQEALAEAATVSPRTVSDLERGVNRTARMATTELLATALGLAGLERRRSEERRVGKECRARGGGEA